MIRRIITLGFASVVLFTASTVLIAGGRRSESSFRKTGPTPIMKLDEVKPGMRGTIKTVFQGNRIEEFGFKVLGVMRNAFGPKQDIILVRLLGEKPEFTGVVSGMSGSPVYIDEKLIGALSLRFGSFTKEPIGGVTPIESMLSLFDLKQTSSPERRARPAREVGADDGRGMTMLELPRRMLPESGDRPGFLEPIPTPLFFPGFNQEVIDRFAPMLRGRHLVPLRVGSVSSGGVHFNPGDTTDFVPGAPIAAMLVAGDLNIYAVGTMSYRDGDRILAFGHPFFQLGGTDMPMATASILTTLASQSSSFKIAQVGDIVGTIRQDRLTAIMGLVGVKPNMIPVSVKVHTPSRGVVPYHYEIFQHSTLTPILFGITLYASITNSLEQSSEMTLDVEGHMRLEGHPDVTFKDAFTSSSASFFQPVPIVAANRINGLFDRLFNNGFEAAKITGVEVEFTLSEERRVAAVEELRVAQREVRPGEEVDVYAFLRLYRGETVVKHLRLKVPDNVRRGDQLTLMASDASTLRSREWWRTRANVTSLDGLIALLNREETNNHLYVRLSKSAPGYFMKDQLLPSLPPSVISVIESGRVVNEAAKVSEASLLTESIDLGYVVRGHQELTLVVK